MNAEQDLYAALTGAPAVTALVSTRIYPDVAPQEVAVPCIAFSRVATEYVQTIHGPILGQRASLEVSCMANTRSSAEAIADAVLAAAAAARFIAVGRRADFDPDSALWAAVLSIDYWQI